MTRKLKVILFKGPARCGKDEAAARMAGYFHISGYKTFIHRFAFPLKELCEKSFKNTTDGINTCLEEFVKNIKEHGPRSHEQETDIAMLMANLYTLSENWWDKKNVVTRGILQNVGTEIFRDNVDRDYWVKKVIQKIQDEYAHSEKPLAFFLPDFRFENEFKLLDDIFDVSTVEVVRNVKAENAELTASHISEKMDFKCNYICDNNGSLEHLTHEVASIAHKIITD